MNSNEMLFLFHAGYFMLNATLKTNYISLNTLN